MHFIISQMNHYFHLFNTLVHNRRTLRRLFAMARGVCLITEEWLYNSVSSQSWANVGHYLHPSCAAMFRNMRDGKDDVYSSTI